MMSVGDIAGLIAAIAFAVLSGSIIYPLIRLGKMFDQVSQTVKESGDHAIPAIDESLTTMKRVNKTLDDVNVITDSTRTTLTNISALTDLYGTFLGKPIIKLASIGYSIKDTFSSFFNKHSDSAESKSSEHVSNAASAVASAVVSAMASAVSSSSKSSDKSDKEDKLSSSQSSLNSSLDNEE